MPLNRNLLLLKLEGYIYNTLSKQARLMATTNIIYIITIYYYFISTRIFILYNPFLIIHFSSRIQECIFLFRANLL